jgi:hypothetical protein
MKSLPSCGAWSWTRLCLMCLMCPMCPIKRESVHPAWKGGLIFRFMGHMRHMSGKPDDRYFTAQTPGVNALQNRCCIAGAQRKKPSKLLTCAMKSLPSCGAWSYKRAHCMKRWANISFHGTNGTHETNERQARWSLFLFAAQTFGVLAPQQTRVLHCKFIKVKGITIIE